MPKWNKEELERLYETLTLEEIGIKFGVSRERIRQVMEKFGIERRTPNPLKGSKHSKSESPDEIQDETPNLHNPVCPVCGGKGYRELEHGLIRLACRECQ